MQKIIFGSQQINISKRLLRDLQPSRVWHPWDVHQGCISGHQGKNFLPMDDVISIWIQTSHRPTIKFGWAGSSSLPLCLLFPSKFTKLHNTHKFIHIPTTKSQTEKLYILRLRKQEKPKRILNSFWWNKFVKLAQKKSLLS